VDVTITRAGAEALDRLRPLWLGAVVTNTDAIRLYERRGFRPAWLYMTRLAGRT
jgi:ribosomal protein S18 acetylase RimI-like enzyme